MYLHALPNTSVTANSWKKLINITDLNITSIDSIVDIRIKRVATIGFSPMELQYVDGYIQYYSTGSGAIKEGNILKIKYTQL